VSGPAQFYNVGPCGTYAEYEGKFFMKERGFICQSCHMPEIDRPVAEGSPIRRGRQHLWRGGHDPDMVQRAVAIQVAASPSIPQAGEDLAVTLTLVNAGAGHKIPTGDPDRYFTVEFELRDRSGTPVAQQTDTMGRWIMWQPAIVELYDNRLLPLASRDYTFTTRLPKEINGLRLTARVRYHIQSERQHQMLIDKFGLTANDPYHFTVYEREVPLAADLAQAFETAEDSRLGCAAPHRSDTKKANQSAG
jgi:hypothetical protein